MAAFGQSRRVKRTRLKFRSTLNHTLGRFETQQLTRRINDASWNAYSAGEDWVVVEAAIEPNACADSVGYQVDHHVSEHMVFREYRFSPIR